MTPAELAMAATGVLRWTDAEIAPTRVRAAALLTRQSIEDSLAHLWRSRAPGVEICSMRAQLLCASSYLRQPGLAQDTTHAWHALSYLCHYQQYEMLPAARELDPLIAVALRLAQAVGDVS